MQQFLFTKSYVPILFKLLFISAPLVSVSCGKQFSNKSRQNNLPFTTLQTIENTILNLANTDSRLQMNPIYFKEGMLIAVPSDNEKIHISGDFNYWQSDAMAEFNGWSWYFIPQQDMPSLDQGRYKLEINNQYHADKRSQFYEYDQHGEISWFRHPKDRSMLARHYIEGTHKVKGRWINILIPSGLENWPVLLMQDGQNLFSPDAAHGSWKVKQTADQHYKKSLIIGIDNSSERMREYTHTSDLNLSDDLGDEYLDFVVNKVLKQSCELYTCDLERVGIAGSSLGGLISLYAGIKYPDQFSFIASLSGTLGWGRLKQNNKTVVEYYAKIENFEAKIYLDSGGSPGQDGRCLDQDNDGFPEDDSDDSDNFCMNAYFKNSLSHKLDLTYYWETNAGHNEAAWARRFPNVIAEFLK
ncbi:MAG: alpha/beta hydrolase [Oligoflexales bacterium]|nr:alpha/beta hydrolase [Oligoflexales bacterium]